MQGVPPGQALEERWNRAYPAGQARAVRCECAWASVQREKVNRLWLMRAANHRFFLAWLRTDINQTEQYCIRQT